MIEFGLEEKVKQYAASKGWDYVFALDDNEVNKVLDFDQSPANYVLIFTDNPTPTNEGLITVSVSYACDIKLGRKYDADGLSAELMETHEQKKDRRLQEMKAELNTMVKVLSCDNDLTSSGTLIETFVNRFDNNVDFVAMQNLIFTHEPTNE